VSNFQNDPTLNKALNILKSEFNFSKSYLFGSKANSTDSMTSDYDLVLVVLNSEKDELERRIQARTLLRDFDSSFDVFIYTQKEFDQYKSDFGSIAETALNTGIELDFL